MLSCFLSLGSGDGYVSNCFICPLMLLGHKSNDVKPFDDKFLYLTPVFVTNWGQSLSFVCCFCVAGNKHWSNHSNGRTSMCVQPRLWSNHGSLWSNLEVGRSSALIEPQQWQTPWQTKGRNNQTRCIWHSGYCKSVERYIITFTFDRTGVNYCAISRLCFPQITCQWRSVCDVL